MAPSGEKVQAMFSEIAPRYDLLNRLLSFGIDRRWRKRTVKEVVDETGLQVLDLCCGTGDLALAFHRAGARVTGADFALPMLPLAREKARKEQAPLEWLQADALKLPFAAESFDVVSVAFGVRNLEDPRHGLSECARVLRPGGRLAVLEFFPVPGALWGRLFRFYFHRVLPAMAWIVRTGRTGAYRYLPDSVDDFATHEQFADWMGGAGFEDVRQVSFSGGVARLVIGRKAADAG